MPENASSATPLTFLTDLFCKALSDAISTSASSPSPVAVAQNEASAPAGPFVSYGLAATGALHGKATFQIPIPEAVWLAQKFLSESADPGAELNAQRKQAVQDFLAKTAKLAEAALEPQVGATSLKIDAIETVPSGGAAVTLQVAESDAKSISVKLQFDAEFLAAVNETLDRAQEAAPNNPVPAAAPTAGPGNLDLLLGVDLNLTLRFGQRTLTLREIMELSSGSIIELNRQVQEPADLLLGDKLIARGEVVVVDGNYGLRITELAESSPGSNKLALHSVL
jgi:flagellar motor switch protein FliN/FliY